MSQLIRFDRNGVLPQRVDTYDDSLPALHKWRGDQFVELSKPLPININLHFFDGKNFGDRPTLDLAAGPTCVEANGYDSFRIDGLPPDAEIFVNDQPQGAAGADVLEIVPPGAGTYRVRVEYRHFLVWHGDFIAIEPQRSH